MKRLSLIFIGSVLAVAAVVPAAIPDPVKLDTGLYDAVFAKQLTAIKTH